MALNSIKAFTTGTATTDNTDINGNNVAEGCPTAGLNNAIRALASFQKMDYLDRGGKLETGGSSNTYTLTTNATLTAYNDGDRLHFIANHSATGAATLNVDSVGAKAIRIAQSGTERAIRAGDIFDGGHYVVQYQESANSAAGAWMLVNPTVESRLLLPEGSAPSTAASEGALYTKDTGGQPELFFREESDGDEVQITSGGQLAGRWKLLGTATASNSTAVAFTGIPSTARIVQIDFTNVAPVSDGANLQLRTDSDNGASYDASSGDYQYGLLITTVGGSPTDAGAASATAIILGSSVGNGAGETMSGRLVIHMPGTAHEVAAQVQTWGVDANGANWVAFGGGNRHTSADVDAIQFTFTAGNVSTGFFTATYLE